ncbi:protein-L-isoaspartate O-methyltransferase family protein [Actinoplanes subtropicus]|uniref:protein-L-isoaspartate O-methyltransferase family protein n=1 Tax=Actinoplanes subtropicus TaxID=543632 RepID=UPI0004C3D9C6|nr:methyltransferase domain-containing protein [Actinoplanes subtropicus]
MTGPRGDYLDQIRQDGVDLPPELAEAFASVPREAFVPDGFQRRDGSWVRPADPDFLGTVYSNDVLVTKMDGRVPISSSSQPSLMAIMILALRVTPGLRVLEIGAGTGYNAALLASLGATITSIDVQEDVAVRARSALARAGIAGVRVEHADGYLGAPGSRFDRVIVTVGIAGVSPHWLAQLDPGGFVLAPVAHAGTDPVLRVSGPPEGPVTGVPICPAGFMRAAGPLNADHPGAFPPPVAAGALAEMAEAAPPRFDPPLDDVAYRGLWYAAGVLSRRATLAMVPGKDHLRLALVDTAGTGGAVVLPDGSVLAGGPEAATFAALAVDILDRWTTLGGPPMRAWRVEFSRAGDPASPIWVPDAWEAGE